MRFTIHLFTLLIVFFPISFAHAQDKVVVIPLNSSSGKANVSYVQKSNSGSINATITEIAKLTDSEAGGVLSVHSSVRIVLTGAVTIGNQASIGQFSVVECQFQVSDNGGTFANVGVPMSTESIGNSNHDQRADIPLTAVLDRPAGSYDARIVCIDTFHSASSLPVFRSVAFSAVANPN